MTDYYNRCQRSDRGDNDHSSLSSSEPGLTASHKGTTDKPGGNNRNGGKLRFI